MMKIIITGSHNIDKFNIVKKLTDINDDLSMMATFTSDIAYDKVITDNGMYYMSGEDVELSYKNNALMYISTENYISHGITMDSFYNDDVCCMSIADFNNISDHLLIKYDVLIVWIDAAIEDKRDKATVVDLRETKYLLERLEYLPYLYFVNEPDEKIIDVINKYVIGDDIIKKSLLEEHN